MISACSADEDDHEGKPTDSTCQPGSTLTYESFGRSFMDSYCVRCHSASLSGDARNGAPAGHDFDTFQGVFIVAEHIDEYAASGPAATNTLMPPSAPKPSLSERQQLGELLACELAK